MDPVSLLVLHGDATERARIADALRQRGQVVAEAADVDGAIEAADQTPVLVVLADPKILEDEMMDIGTRIGVRTGKNPKIVALTHLADPARKKALAVHEASLLSRPVEDLDALAASADAAAQAALVAQAPKAEPTLGKLKVERLSRTPEEPLDAPPSKDGNPLVAVIVDDDEMIRNLLKDILAPRGYSVEAFASANGALRWIGKNTASVAVILSDLQMNHMDGFEFKQSLPETLAKIPFFLVTGEASSEHEKIAKTLGVAAVIGKPIQARALCKQVREMIIARRLMK